MNEKLYQILDALNRKGDSPFIVDECGPDSNGGFQFAKWVFKTIDTYALFTGILFLSEDLTKGAVNSRYRDTVAKIFKKLEISVNLTSFGRGAEVQNQNTK